MFKSAINYSYKICIGISLINQQNIIGKRVFKSGRANKLNCKFSPYKGPSPKNLNNTCQGGRGAIVTSKTFEYN